MNKYDFRCGDLVEVRYRESDEWGKAIFVTYNPIPNARYPYIVSSETDEYTVEFRAYAHIRKADTIKINGETYKLIKVEDK